MTATTPLSFRHIKDATRHSWHPRKSAQRIKAQNRPLQKRSKTAGMRPANQWPGSSRSDTEGQQMLYNLRAACAHIQLKNNRLYMYETTSARIKSKMRSVMGLIARDGRSRVVQNGGADDDAATAFTQHKHIRHLRGDNSIV